MDNTKKADIILKIGEILGIVAVVITIFVFLLGLNTRVSAVEIKVETFIQKREVLDRIIIEKLDEILLLHPRVK